MASPEASMPSKALVAFRACSGLCLVVFSVACSAEPPKKEDGGPLCDGEPVAVGRAEQSEDGTVRAEIIDATPLPPIQGENAWAFDLFGSDDAPLLGAEVIANIYMPLHDHNIRRSVDETNPGRYELDPIPLTMAGPWEITLEVTTVASPDVEEDVLFEFCVPE